MHIRPDPDAVTAPGQLTDDQVRTIQADPQVSEDLRSLCAMALAGHAGARWMLGKAVDSGAIRSLRRLEAME